MKSTFKTIALAALLLPGIASAEMTQEEIAKASQNPLTAMYSLPIQNNTIFNVGPDNKTLNVANFQPVLPFDMNDDWAIVTRTIVPIVSSPVGAYSKDNYERVFDLGDTTFTAFFTPKQASDSGWMWGVGPVLYLPTATDSDLGKNLWGAGASAVALKMAGKIVYGALISNVWSFAGADDSTHKINAMTLQPFLNYNLDDGWFIASSPIITADWEQDNDNRWTVPLGLGVGRAMKVGGIPLAAQIHSYYNVVTPDNGGGDWQLRVQVQMLFPR